MKLTSDVEQRKQRSQHNSPNPNNDYKQRKSSQVLTPRETPNSESRILFSAAILKFGDKTIGFRCSLVSGDCSIQAFSDFHVPEVRNKDRCRNRKIKI